MGLLAGITEHLYESCVLCCTLPGCHEVSNLRPIFPLPCYAGLASDPTAMEASDHGLYPLKLGAQESTSPNFHPIHSDTVTAMKT